MSSNHTPGPWYACWDSNCVGVKPNASSGYPYNHEKMGAICVLYDGEYIDNPNRQNDARLIAAAPAMLQELEDVLDFAISEKLALLGEPEIQSLRAIISLAKGEL